MGLVLPYDAYIPHLGIGIAYAGLFYLEIYNLCLVLSVSTYKWKFVMSLRSNSGLELLSRV